jgi:uncharacterized protein (DUF885 family)
MGAILEARADAEATLGDAFDITGFHDALLRHGSLPLPLIEQAVSTWAD